MEDNSNYAWSFFLKEKSNLAGVMLGLIKNLKNKYNIQVQYLCCNNTSENVALEKACKQEGLGVDIEYTAPGMPQQNGCIYAMLNGRKFNAFLCNGLQPEAANTSTLLNNTVLTPSRTLSPCQHFWGREREASYL